MTGMRIRERQLVRPRPSGARQHARL